MKDWPQVTQEVTAQLRNLRADAPAVMQAFSDLARAATAEKALYAKTKELIALAIAFAVHCDDCIAFHVKAALERGAGKAEVAEALGMAIYMGAGPSVMYATLRSKRLPNLPGPGQRHSPRGARHRRLSI